MTLVMGLNRSIYPFTTERPRDLSALTPEPASSGVYKLNHAAHITLGKKNWARISNQGNTVHANFVISGSCLRNRGYVSNRDVPYRSSLRYNTMGPYTFPRDNTVAANHTHQLYWSLWPPRGSYGSWRWTFNRANFIIDVRDPWDVSCAS